MSAVHGGGNFATMLEPGESEEPVCMLFGDKRAQFAYQETIFYSDVFNQPHMTQFCLTIQYDPLKKEQRVLQCPGTQLDIT
jgi:hypothetical protein